MSFSDGWAASPEKIFVMEFDQPIKNIRYEYYDKDAKKYVPVEQGVTEIGGGIRDKYQYARAYVEFDTSKSGLTVEAKLALSNVEIGDGGKKGASLNMTEVAGKNFFDQVRQTTVNGKSWPNCELKGMKFIKQTFYTALYHSLLGQTIHSDLDGRYVVSQPRTWCIS